MHPHRLVGLGLIGVFALTGCAGSITPVTVPSATPDRDVQVSTTFGTDGGTALTYDPELVPVGARGAVSAQTGDAGTTVTLAVRGLAPQRPYGAHVHTQPCGPTGAVAGPGNEIWLDITTDAAGAGTATATVPWAFDRDRRAQSVIIHAMPTATGPGEAGTAGARAACISVEF